MDYAVFAWLCFLGVADPRDEWLPEVFTIRYDPSTSRYGLFPTVTCAKLSQPYPRATDGSAAREVVLDEHFDGLTRIVEGNAWAGLVNGKYAADTITFDFHKDTTVPANMKPWAEIIPKMELDPNTELFCVATWGVGCLSVFLTFTKAKQSFSTSWKLVEFRILLAVVVEEDWCQAGA